jgi:hypothetical protein
MKWTANHRDASEAWLSELVEAETGLEASAEARDRIWESVRNRLDGGPPPPEISSDPGAELLATTPAAVTAATLSLVAGGAALVGLVWIAASPEVRESTAPGIEVERGRSDDEGRFLIPPPAEPAEPAESDQFPEGDTPLAPPHAVGGGSEEPEGEGSGLGLDASGGSVPSKPTAREPWGSRGKSRGPRGSRRPSTSEPEIVVMGVAAEIELVGRAETALRAGHPRRALSILEAHERRFPRGDLAQEREKIAVVALCRSGRARAARERSQEFLSSWPSSPYADVVRRTCSEADAVEPVGAPSKTQTQAATDPPTGGHE